MPWERYAPAGAFLLGAAVLAACHEEIDLRASCRSDLPQACCVAGNIAGLCSTLLWFVVLVPQVLKNCARRSVMGLSYEWAVANFLAAYINVFFAFRQSLPAYAYFAAVYMPVLELIILGQFALFSRRRWHRWFSALLVAVCGTYFALNLVYWQAMTPMALSLEWLAIFLWSSETIPQLWLNHHRQSTDGQAASSVLVTWAGKTTDFATNFLLNLPLQYNLMTFFSTTLAYVNVLQFFFFAAPRDRRVWRCRRPAILLIAVMILACSVLLVTKLRTPVAVVAPLGTALVIFGGFPVWRAMQKRADSDASEDGSTGACESSEAAGGWAAAPE